jgi:hypothetical protein
MKSHITEISGFVGCSVDNAGSFGAAGGRNVQYYAAYALSMR